MSLKKETVDQSKARPVQKMFDAIATRYDVMNRVMTLGQDQRWRKFVVKKAEVPSGGIVLDLASGTGDIAVLTKRYTPSAIVLAGDFALNMLKEARRRFEGSDIGWHASDANSLPYGDECFDAVTFGYLLRNVDDVSGVLREIHRVLKPGGSVVCLDTTPPKKNILYPFILFYLKCCIPVMGKFLADNEAAYAYLTGSTMGFYSAARLAETFGAAGFENVGYSKFMFGTVAVHWGVKR